MDIFKGYKGELEINAIPVKKDEVFQYDVPADLVAVVAWPGKINLETSIKNGQIIWKSPIIFFLLYFAC